MQRPGGDDDADESTATVVGRFLWDVLLGVAIIAILVVVVFGLSGVWPPFVAIESGSMEPHMSAGDLVFLVEGDRYAGDDGVADTGLVTLEHGEEIGHLAFGKPGHVVVFNQGEDTEVSIIHRLHLYVEEGENWFDRANPEYIDGADDCDELSNCPAPHDGFITKGDDNPAYDQVNNHMEVIKPEWVEGRAAFRLPYLGELRLTL